MIEEHFLKLLRNSSGVTFTIPRELLNSDDYLWFIDNFDKNGLRAVNVDAIVRGGYATINIESLRVFGDLKKEEKICYKENQKKLKQQ